MNLGIGKVFQAAGMIEIEVGDHDMPHIMRRISQPFPRTSRAFALMLNIRFRESETAIRQIERNWAAFSPGRGLASSVWRTLLEIILGEPFHFVRPPTPTAQSVSVRPVTLGRGALVPRNALRHRSKRHGGLRTKLLGAASSQARC